MVEGQRQATSAMGARGRRVAGAWGHGSARPSGRQGAGTLERSVIWPPGHIARWMKLDKVALRGWELGMQKLNK